MSLREWMDGYRRAWETNAPQDIEVLFTESARYFTAPYRQPWDGRPAIVEGWHGRREEPGTWSFRWEPIVDTPEVAVIRGWTAYPQEGHDYSNLWVIRFAEDGRCREFIEWWMRVEGPATPPPGTSSPAGE
jgi:hypothetical protein